MKVMDKLNKESVKDIYNLFNSKLPKQESLYLVGNYYGETSLFENKETHKNIIIGQQLLTFLEKNSLSSLDIENIGYDFFDEDDRVDSNCNPAYMINGNIEISFEKIKNIIPDINSYLEDGIDIPIDTKKQEQIIIDIPEIKKQPKKEVTPIVFLEKDNARETIEKFLDCLPFQPKKKKSKKKPLKVLEYKPGNGRFTSSFIKHNYLVTVLEEGDFQENIKKLQVRKVQQPYVQQLEPESYNAIWAYSGIMNLKKQEIIQVVKNIEQGLVFGGYALISFLYGEGHKTNNGKYYTLQNEESINEIVSKTRKLQIQKIWKSTYKKVEGDESTRISVILKKQPGLLKFYEEEEQIKELPSSIDIQKIQLISYAKIQEPFVDGINIKQKLTITKDGRFWFVREVGRISPEANKIISEITEKKNSAIDKDIVQKIFFKLYQSTMLQEREFVDGEGYWELMIKATNDDEYNAKGSFGNTVFFKDEDLCKYIRDNIPVENLWVFNEI